jgi:hypothetical protein
MNVQSPAIHCPAMPGKTRRGDGTNAATRRISGGSGKNLDVNGVPRFWLGLATQAARVW